MVRIDIKKCNLDCNAEVNIEESEKVSQTRIQPFTMFFFALALLHFTFSIVQFHLSVSLFLKLAVVYVQFCSSIGRL